MKIARINKKAAAQQDKDPLTWQAHTLLPVSCPLWDTGTLGGRTTFQRRGAKGGGTLGFTALQTPRGTRDHSVGRVRRSNL